LFSFVERRKLFTGQVHWMGHATFPHPLLAL
jgi:hypothetical protein